MAGDDDEMFTTRSLNVTSKTRKQHLIARSDLIYITSSKRLRWTLCTTCTAKPTDTSDGRKITAVASQRRCDIDYYYYYYYYYN